MASRGFQFKQFFVAHDKCAMKVGTDGTLLGAMVTAPIPPFGHPSQLRILDVGTGSGLIALMIAQRFPTATIDAIDIDEEAMKQAKENFAASPWSDRLHAHRVPLQEWKNEDENDDEDDDENENDDYLYHLIVSNPPYFQNSLKNPDKGREMARHTDTLSYDALIEHSARLLHEGGSLWLILPAEAEKQIRQTGQRHGLVTSEVIHVHTKPGKPVKRVIICLAKEKEELVSTAVSSRNFYIESAYSPRSEEYAELTKDFYL